MRTTTFEFAAAALGFLGILISGPVGNGLAPEPAQAAEAAPDSKELRIGVSEYPGSFHPNFNGQGIRSYVGWMTYRPLTAYDKDWRLYCALCTELPSRKNGRIRDVTLPDGRKAVAVRFTLRPDAVWGDGTPVTTRDVAFTWEVGSNPAVGVIEQDFFTKDVVKLEVADEKTFILYRQPNTCTPENSKGLILLPEHVERAAYERDPANYKVSSRYESDTTNPGLWFGPYRVTRVEAGASIVLERNPTWYGRKPYFDRIVVRTIENSERLEQALLNGEVDYVSGEYGFTVQRAAQLEPRQQHRFKILWQPGFAYRHLDLNHDHPALGDVRVRRALLHALNRLRINDRLFYGRNILAHADIHPMDRGYEKDVYRYPYDPVRAGWLLDQAGWRAGQDGIRRNEDGVPLEIELWAGAGDRTIELEQQFIEDSWRQIGVRTILKNATARVLFGEILQERRFNGAALFSWISLPHDPQDTVLHSRQIPTAENGWSGQNFLGYSNPRMDRILDQIGQVCDPSANQALWSEMQTLYAEELPALPIFFLSQPYFMPLWLEGVEPTGHQFESTMGIENWRRAEDR
ncbi:peptide ABC transporter substrate-binding protein [Indioceanicola profundi]|uniref:peptide ABC transporter substrate-binding protein n=1 Tax=Indioceanicola profundi TaxID=2220096 RepID=UPI000E6ADE3F|nr:peptide ABC transporter substrate-binding protein [Indioceanicola profundi]